MRSPAPTPLPDTPLDAGYAFSFRIRIFVPPCTFGAGGFEHLLQLRRTCQVPADYTPTGAYTTYLEAYGSTNTTGACTDKWPTGSVYKDEDNCSLAVSSWRDMAAVEGVSDARGRLQSCTPCNNKTINIYIYIHISFENTCLFTEEFGDFRRCLSVCPSMVKKTSMSH